MAFVLALAGAAGNTPSQADAGEWAKRLEALTPDYPAPPIDALDVDGDLDYAASLLGVSFDQHGARLEGEVPVLASDAPLTVRTYWRANARTQSPIAVQLHFWDHLNAIRETIDLRVGPTRTDPPWELGGVYVDSSELDLRPIARLFSGHGWLGIDVRASSTGANAMRARQLLEIALLPDTRESNLLNEDVAAAFGDQVRFIDWYARLGFGARATMPVPAEWQTGNRTVGVVSSMSYRAPSQGETVCRVVVDTEDGIRELVIRAGIETAICNIDMFEPGTANHGKVDVFASRDSGQLAADGTPGQLHSYYALIPLPDGVERVTTIEFICDAPTVMDVLGVALLP